MKRAVAHEPKPAGVGADVAADLAPALGAQVQRRRHAARVERVLQVLEDASGLAHDRPGDRVHGQHRVHASHAEDNLVVHRDAAADEPGVAALGHDREPARVAVAQDRGDLGGARGQE